MSEVQWIKLYVNTFNVSRKLKQIEQMKGGDTIIVVWIKLLCLAGAVNDGGLVYVTPEIPFTVEGLAEELRKPVKAVRQALDTLVLYEQIAVDGDGFIRVSSWDKYQDMDKLEKIREQTRKRVAKCRESKKLRDGNADCNADCNVTVTPLVTQCNATEEEEEEEEEFHSFSLSRARPDVTDEGTDKERVKRELMGGTLGGGVIMLSDEEFDSLLDELSLDELNYYCGIVRDCERSGKKFKRKTHYQAIMEMAIADRKKAVSPKNKKQPTEDHGSFETDDFFESAVRKAFDE